MPFTGQALQFVKTSVTELKAGSSDQISQGARHEYLACLRRGHHTAGDVNRDSLQLLLSGLGLTRMQADTDRETELSDRRHDRLSSMKRLRWLLERREESIPSRVNLSAMEPAKLSANRGVVGNQQLLPLPIPEFHGKIRRPDDVGKEHRGDESPIRMASLIHRPSLRFRMAASRPEMRNGPACPDFPGSVGRRHGGVCAEQRRATGVRERAVRLRRNRFAPTVRPSPPAGGYPIQDLRRPQVVGN